MSQLIIDGGYFAHRTKSIPFFRNMVVDGDRIGLSFGMMNTIKKLSNDGYDDFTVAWDKGFAHHRKDILDSYKASRGDSPAHGIAEREYELAEIFLGRYGVEQYYHPKLEADDIMGWLANEKDDHVEIYTTDKDLYQLVGDGVTIHHPDKGIIDVEGVKDEYGVKPGEIPRLLAIMGDTADDIDGIKGIGPKTASKYINEGLSSLTERQRGLIENNGDLIERNLKLTKLKLDIEPETIDVEKDLDKLKGLFEKYGMESLMGLTEDEKKSESFMSYVD